jgi:hypothetical protein
MVRKCPITVKPLASTSRRMGKEDTLHDRCGIL